MLSSLLGLGVFLAGWASEARAGDPATDAATAAAAAAQALADAAQAAMAAAQSSSAASDVASKDANASGKADDAAQNAQQAAKASNTASTAAEDAFRAAKAAQDQEDRGNTDAAKSSRDQAQKDAKTAQDAAAQAKKNAVKADQDNSDANSQYKNDQANSSVNPPSDAQKKHFQEQKAVADNLAEAQGASKDRGKSLQRKALDLVEEEDTYHDNQAKKNSTVQPPQQPTKINFRASSFFDVFTPFNIEPFPNPPHPDQVPEPGRNPGERGELQIRILNDNPFAVALTGLQSNLYGDAISFTPFTAAQIVPANSAALINIGTATFDGPPGGFTAADFSFHTDSSHPGLGAEVSVNFDVVPEPSSLALLLLGGTALVLSHRFCRRGGK
jgi:hypothetical protein